MKKLTKVGIAIVATLGGIAWASGDWSGAKSKADDFKSKADQLVRDMPSELLPDLLKNLISNHSDFAKCKHVEIRIDGSKQCPDVDSDSHLRESSASWREGC